ncbi:NAD(P)/FAD-dependent oxidoreductase [Actinomadura rudentiformis]|uniref:NAD(P)/FAD-dependent oxidoreductase n=1 Tax=Actinomadura rudentiformis TaxID=359158 RepID=A0A6H9YST8_9ACTN|nr:NAD(P)/FAD-dependent oxidoreductase [Actinomadura rudentiformis]KAB2343378.1 NAD(P)/FAD-dependent oxidoreductase [Actinomadura rudentiformis]
MNTTKYDVIVIGGGAAGLSGALALARSRRSVLAIDAGEPRNAPAGHIHNYLGREGTPPGELLAIGRDEVTAYGGEIVSGTVTAARKADDGFHVELADGRAAHARRLLITTGLVDELPDVPDIAERFGRDVLHCPYCHGWEVRDQAIGVLGTNPFGLHQAKLFSQLSADVTYFVHTGPAPSEAEREQLAKRGITFVEGEVAGIEVRDDQLTGVRLRSGEVVSRQALVVSPRFTARADLFEPLGLKPEELEVGGHVFGSYIAADPSGATSVPGVYVAGNVTDLKAQVIVSAAAGLTAGAMINNDLVEEDVQNVR